MAVAKEKGSGPSHRHRKEATLQNLVAANIVSISLAIAWIPGPKRDGEKTVGKVQCKKRTSLVLLTVVVVCGSGVPGSSHLDQISFLGSLSHQ